MINPWTGEINERHVAHRVREAAFLGYVAGGLTVTILGLVFALIGGAL